MSSEYHAKQWLKNEWTLNHSLQRKGGLISVGMYSSVDPILKKTTNQITVPHLFNLKQKVEAQSFGLCSFEYGTKLKYFLILTHL